jgi:hypothetical protein
MKARAAGCGKARGAGQDARFGRALPGRGRLATPALVASRWAVSGPQLHIYQSNVVLSDSVRPLVADW